MRQSLAEPPKMQAMQQAVLDAQVAWERIPIPTIAMIRGACTGGGCGLALTCDLRIATPDAFFAIPPPNSVSPTVWPIPNDCTISSARRVRRKFSTPADVLMRPRPCA